MNSARTELFAESIRELTERRLSGTSRITIVDPVRAREEDLVLFHTEAYVDFVKEISRFGEGYLDYGDTPSFKGVYEASLFPVGNTLNGLDLIMEKKFDHFFNPVHE